MDLSTPLLGDDSNSHEEARDNQLDKGHLKYGCTHMPRRCRIRAPCCNEIFNCRYCHDDELKDGHIGVRCVLRDAQGQFVGARCQKVDDKRTNPPDLASNLDSVDLKDTSLCQLHTVDILGVTASNYVFHLVKLLLASSPSLEVMTLHCSGEVTDPGERLKIKQELQRFPNCSSGAKLLLLGFGSK
ncbi:hypothetical protein ACET3Z_027520 [Daucus carota]